MLVDRYGRQLKNLRISVTHRCNYRCIYCHAEGWSHRAEDILTAEEFSIIARVAMDLGIDEFKLTGGEPLVRSDIVEVVRRIADAKPRDLSMTTNGFLLDELAGKLADAGLMRINVSIPSLKRERYRFVTGVDALDKVLRGIEEAHSYGLKPITINIVLLKGVNEDEILTVVDYASRYGARVRVIELEPISIPRTVFERFYVSSDRIAEELEKISIKKYTRYLNARPVFVTDTGIEVEIVKWVGNPIFCAYCNRARLSADGILKPCIMARDGIDLKPFLRPRIDVEGLKRAFIELNAMRKPFYSMNR